MLILTPTDKLQLVTGSAGIIDVHASWMDNASGAVVPGRTNTAGIITAVTTDIIGSPTAGVFRNIKTVHIFNRGVAANDVTLRHFDGSVSVDLHKVTLLPNKTLQYIDEVGFLIPAALRKWASALITSTNATWPVPGGIQEMFIELWGAGGSGGGRIGDGAGNIARGTGGGAGGYLERYYAGIMDATLAVTIGTGGSGSGDGSPGFNGTPTTIVGANLGTLTANGGAGGSLGPYNAGGSGGTASGGDLNITGGGGTANTGSIGNTFGVGGDCPRGGLGGQTNVSTPGGIPGGGGSGANHDGSSPSGAGARGQALIWTR